MCRHPTARAGTWRPIREEEARINLPVSDLISPCPPLREFRRKDSAGDHAVGEATVTSGALIARTFSFKFIKDGRIASLSPGATASWNPAVCTPPPWADSQPKRWVPVHKARGAERTSEGAEGFVTTPVNGPLTSIPGTYSQWPGFNQVPTDPAAFGKARPGSALKGRFPYCWRCCRGDGSDDNSTSIRMNRLSWPRSMALYCCQFPHGMPVAGRPRGRTVTEASSPVRRPKSRQDHFLRPSPATARNRGQARPAIA